MIDTDDTIRRYYDTVRDQYPDLNLEHFMDICKAPFLFFRKMMELPELPIIMIKYFGKFLIYPGKAKSIIQARTEELERGEITQEQFELYTNNLKEHIDEGEDNEDIEGGESSN